jgi:hypothetical protein
MPAKKTPGTARYRVLRDCALPAAEPGGQGTIGQAGELVDLDPDVAALLVRDGMVTPAEEA